jgi:heme/copper-type cytochrome/quinol oxidase subunit 2
MRQGGRALAVTLPFALLLAGTLLAAGPETTRDIRVSDSGFTPRRIEVRRGDAVRLLLTTSDGEHCFAIDELRIEKRVVPDHTTRVDFTPEKAGSLAFYDCLASDHKGTITVAE